MFRLKKNGLHKCRMGRHGMVAIDVKKILRL